MSNMTTLAQNIVFTAWDWPKPVIAKNGLGTMQEALGSKRFVSALLDCAFFGLRVAFPPRHHGGLSQFDIDFLNPELAGLFKSEPITNFVAPVLLSVDQVIQNASHGLAPIRIEALEEAAKTMRDKDPSFSVDPALVDAVAQFARSYSPAFAVPAPENAGAVPA